MVLHQPAALRRGGRRLQHLSGPSRRGCRRSQAAPRRAAREPGGRAGPAGSGRRTMPSSKRLSVRPSDTLQLSGPEVVTRTPTTLSVSFSALNSAGCAPSGRPSAARHGTAGAPAAGCGARRGWAAPRGSRQSPARCPRWAPPAAGGSVSEHDAGGAGPRARSWGAARLYDVRVLVHNDDVPGLRLREAAQHRLRAHALLSVTAPAGRSR